MRFWTPERLDFLRKNIRLSDAELAATLNSTESGVNQARLRYRILRPKPDPIQDKVCPICREKKPVSCFGKYFSKERNKYRIQNYCNKCTPEEKCKRSREYYQKKGDKVRSCQKKYRKKNKDKIRPKRKEFNRKYRQELHPLYVIEQLRRRSGLTSSDLREAPEVIDAEAMRLKLIRTIKSKKNEKQNDRPAKPSICRAGKAKR